MTTPDPMRRRPEQVRSRERVDAILAAATELIAEHGTEPPTMTDIADRAGMKLTALYRYFPNKQAILRDLALRVLDHDRRALVVPAAASAVSGEPNHELVHSIVTAYWHLHRDEPFRLRLRAAIHADAELSALDLDDTRHNASILAVQIAELTGNPDLATIERRLLLLLSLVDSLVYTAAQVSPAEADNLIDDFTTMTIALLTQP